MMLHKQKFLKIFISRSTSAQVCGSHPASCGSAALPQVDAWYGRKMEKVDLIKSQIEVD